MSLASDVQLRLSMILTNFGINVTVNRVQAATQYDIYATPLDATTNTFTATIVIESEKMDLTPTLAGGKPVEKLKLLTLPGIFLTGDEIQYGGHTYKVNFLQPTPFQGVNVVDYIYATREVSP